MGIVAVVLTFVGYIPYLRDTLKGKTKPHVYSWFLWSFITFIIFAQQISAGGGAGAFVTLATAILCLTTFILAMRGGKKDITKADTASFIFSLVAVGMWLLAKQAVISAILLATINFLGMIPTVRKSWTKPHSETLFSWSLSALNNLLGIIALQNYSLVTWLYPASCFLENGLFSLMLVVRRKVVSLKN